MASESFKEDLPRGCGSFVEKLEKRERGEESSLLWCLEAPGQDVCQAEEELPEAARRPELCTESPSKGSCLCMPRLTGVCMCIGICICMFAHLHMHVPLCATIGTCVCACIRVCHVFAFTYVSAY